MGVYLRDLRKVGFALAPFRGAPCAPAARRIENEIARVHIMAVKHGVPLD